MISRVIPGRIEPKKYHQAVSKLRNFFEQRGFVEVHTQNRRSILAACEDPANMTTYNYCGQIWPLPQTGQMWLEYELLTNPSLKGLYCVSTSYRQEPNPIPGRHELIFPMFEFETHGNMEDMIALEAELVHQLGFRSKQIGLVNTTTARNFPRQQYANIAAQLRCDEIGAEEEMELKRRFGAVFFLTHFPPQTWPFWNMARCADGQTAKKVDVLLEGVETIGSAERSCDVKEMRDHFYTIQNGQYAKTLFSAFTQERVERELDEFLNLKFFPRYGGGIGLTRLIRAMEISQIL